MFFQCQSSPRKAFSRETFVEARSSKVRHLLFMLLQNLHLVSNGLNLINPFRHHPYNYVSQAMIHKASANLCNIAFHKAYPKQKRLSTLLDSSSLHTNEIIHEPSHKTEPFVFLNDLFHKKTFKLLRYKKKTTPAYPKFPFAFFASGSRNHSCFLTKYQPSMGFRKQPNCKLCLTYLT